MTRCPLILRQLLDVRSRHDATARPVAGAVNIPLAELASRTLELPPRTEQIRVVAVDESARVATDWLNANGRRAAECAEFTFSHEPDSCIGRLWSPAVVLEAVVSKLPSGAALDLACGTGRDAVFMASLGWRLMGVDVLPDALQKAYELASRCAPAIEPIEWRQLDLESGNAQFDRRFDLITCFRYLHRPLISKFREWLAPGGSVVMETFTTLHRERHGKPSRDEHVLRTGELAVLFGGWNIRDYSESWIGDTHAARIRAVEPGCNPR